MKDRIRVQLLFLLCALLVALPAQAQNGAAPNVLSLPTGPGSIGGIGENVQPNLNMGLMSYSIKVVVPAGRGSATPNPSITYSSSAGAGLMGIGWNFSVGSRIERGTVRGLPTYTNNDVFFAGSELVKLPKGPFYRARYEGGFVRYRWVQKDTSDQAGYWLAEYPDGSKGYFGANSKGQLRPNAHVAGNDGTFAWELVTKVDRNGNRIEYSYFKDGSKAYPDQISWVFDKSGDALYQLRFTYEDRKDHISDGKPGFDVQTKKRLKEVRITSGGQRFRSYSFEYEDATGLSRLIKVTRYGRDASKAYPVSFSMRYSEATIDNSAIKLVTMPTSLGLNMGNGDADFLDINGDGLPDLVDTSNSNHTFYLNVLKLDKDMKQVSHDFPKEKQVQQSRSISARLSNPTVQLMDYNGDGTTDLVDAVNMKIYLNKGNSRWEDGSETLKSYPISTNNPNMRFFDYDGDKKIDMIFSDGTITYYWLNDGQGNWKKQAGTTQIGASFDKDKLRLIDINGDGLMDVVHITKDSLRYRKYLGYGKWSGWIKVQVDLSQVKNFPVSEQAQFNDMNGDGMADMVMLLGSKIYYMVNRNGNTFTTPIELNTGNLNIPDSSKATIRIVDINGNGSRDIVWIDGSGKVSYLELFDRRPNLMTQISNGIGQRINVAYGSSVYFKLRDDTCKVGVDKGCAGPWENKLPMAFTVVTQITTWASQSKQPLQQQSPGAAARPQVQKIYYHHGFYDGKEKKFRGYRHVQTLFDGDSSVGVRKDEIKYDVGDKDAYRHGLQLERTISDGAGKLFRKVLSKWGDCPVALGSGVEGKSLTPPIRFVCSLGQDITLIEGETDKSKWKTLRSSSSYDGYGNVISSVALGDIATQGDEKYTQREYALPADPNDPNAPWLLRYPKVVRHCDKEPSVGPCAEVQYYYDGEAYKGLPLGQIAKGNPSRSTAKAADGEQPIHLERTAYDEYGNAVGYMDALGVISAVEWDSQYRRFPTKNIRKKKDGTTLTYSTAWDIRYGIVQSSTDWNGQVTRYSYDAFGRLLQTSRPGDGANTPSDTYEYKLQAPISTIIHRRRSTRNGAQDIVRIQCFDGLGRPLQQLYKLGDGRYQVAAHVEYNRLGLVARRARMYAKDSGSCAFAMPKDAAVVQMFYDGLARRVRTISADQSSSRMEYKPLRSIFFDAADTDKDSPHYNTPTITIGDGLGRKIKTITYAKAGEALTTSFRWSAVNVSGQAQMVASVDPAGNEKLQNFDLLGRLRKIQDPDRKTLEMGYDANGSMIRRKDERGIVTLYTYDEFRRLHTVQQEGKPETRITLSYDVASPNFPKATHLKSRLSMVSYPNGVDYTSYDARGNMKTFRRDLLGKSFVFEMSYDNADRLVKRVYPDDRSLSFTYDAVNRLVAMAGLIKSVTYNDAGQLKSWTLANGLTTTRSFDELERVVESSVKGGQILRSRYSYDAIGNYLEIERGYQGNMETRSYEYDALYRLTQASLGGKEVLKYSYDAIGNITSKSSSLQAKSVAHIGAYSYDPARPRAAVKVGNAALKYDASGFMKQHANTTFNWDFLGRMTQAKNTNGNQVKYWYGSMRDRFLKEDNGVHTLYITKDYELRDGVSTIYGVLGRLRVAAWKSTAKPAQLFDDLAPATGTDALKPKADGALNAADAWLYYAARQKLVSLQVKARKPDVDLTRDMLRHRASQLLLGEKKEEKIFFHPGHRGSVLAVTDEKGQVLSRKAYYPFGALKQRSGSVFSYGYMGTERDRATQLNFAKARYLNTRLGRWISPDPAFDSIVGSSDEWNSYWYASNNPIRFIDSSGNNTDSVEITDSALELTAAVGAVALTAYLTRKSSTKVRVGLVGFGVLGASASTMKLIADAIPGESTLDSGFAIAGITMSVGVSIASMVLNYKDQKQIDKLQNQNTNMKRQNSDLKTTLDRRNQALQSKGKWNQLHKELGSKSYKNRRMMMSKATGDKTGSFKSTGLAIHRSGSRRGSYKSTRLVIHKSDARGPGQPVTFVNASKTRSKRRLRRRNTR